MTDSEIKAGDLFVKVDNPTTVWIVERPVPLSDLQPHFRLAVTDCPRRKMTLSESALLDRSLLKRAEA